MFHQRAVVIRKIQGWFASSKPFRLLRSAECFSLVSSPSLRLAKMAATLRDVVINIFQEKCPSPTFTPLLKKKVENDQARKLVDRVN